MQTQEHRQPQIAETKKLYLKNCVPFTDCISEIKNNEVDHVKNIEVVTPMYNLIEYSVNIMLKYWYQWNS